LLVNGGKVDNLKEKVMSKHNRHILIQLNSTEGSLPNQEQMKRIRELCKSNPRVGQMLVDKYQKYMRYVVT